MTGFHAGFDAALFAYRTARRRGRHRIGCCPESAGGIEPTVEQLRARHLLLPFFAT